MGARANIGILFRSVATPTRLAAFILLALLSYNHAVNAADPQGGNSAVVPPPPTRAKQQFVNPEWALDPDTGQSLHWDCVEKNWIDRKTHKAVGFQGAKARDGEVIPPPPKLALPDSEHVTSEGVFARVTQAAQDPKNPERAYDVVSGRFLAWDRAQNTWIDAKTGEALGYLGRKGPSSCPQIARAVLPLPGISPAIGRLLMFDDAAGLRSGQGNFTSWQNRETRLQTELILTSIPSLIGGAFRFVSSEQPGASVPITAAWSFTCVACGSEAACLDSCAASSRKTIASPDLRGRSAMR